MLFFRVKSTIDRSDQCGSTFTLKVAETSIERNARVEYLRVQMSTTPKKRGQRTAESIKNESGFQSILFIYLRYVILVLGNRIYTNTFFMNGASNILFII